MKATIRSAGKVQIIELSGRLVLGETQKLEQAFKSLLADNQTRILIDLRRVSLLDSSGIGELAACKKRARAKDAALKLLKKSMTQFDLSVEFLLGLMYADEIYEEEAQAVGSF